MVSLWPLVGLSDVISFFRCSNKSDGGRWKFTHLSMLLNRPLWVEWNYFQIDQTSHSKFKLYIVYFFVWLVHNRKKAKAKGNCKSLSFKLLKSHVILKRQFKIVDCDTSHLSFEIFYKYFIYWLHISLWIMGIANQSGIN